MQNECSNLVFDGEYSTFKAAVPIRTAPVDLRVLENVLETIFSESVRRDAKGRDVIFARVPTSSGAEREIDIEPQLLVPIRKRDNCFVECSESFTHHVTVKRVPYPGTATIKLPGPVFKSVSRSY